MCSFVDGLRELYRVANVVRPPESASLSQHPLTLLELWRSRTPDIIE